MQDDFDFDKSWLRILSMSLDDELGEEKRRIVMNGSENISSKSDRNEVFQWTKEALSRLDTLADGEQRKTILSNCSCQYPKANLIEFVELYEKTADLHLVHKRLHEHFINFLKENLDLEEELLKEIEKRQMGMAGKLAGQKIIAVKIPKSNFIKEWFKEKDQLKKRAIYCHCPRIRDVMDKKENELPFYHCYCGAGFYKGIWETILKKPVRVEILETVMNGGECCKFAIYL
ncbi:MAG: hypothetical protein ACTSUR_00890 [Candidatus Heimdallarchaeaceae archaeon]